MSGAMKSWGIRVSTQGLHVVDHNGKASGVIKERKSNSVVVDENDKEFHLKEDGIDEGLCAPGTPKKLVAKFSKGFPKSWSRGANQERRRKVIAQELKEVDWRDLPFVGIEFSAIPELYAADFSFPHLIRELKQGKLNTDGAYPIYLFQGAQPCWNEELKEMMEVPYIIAIDCAIPPPDKLVYHSVQLATHSVIDMKSLPSFAKYEWKPYVPKRLSTKINLDSAPIQCYSLSWSGRRSQFVNLEEKYVHYIEFLHPYILLPQSVEKLEPPVVSSVDFVWKYGGKEYPIIFDKEIDRLAVFIPDFVEENKLDEAAGDELKTALKAAFVEKRRVENEKYDAIKKEMAELTKEEEEALRSMKTYKFYPHHPSMNMESFINDKINPYFGNATEVLLPLPQDLEDEEEASYQEKPNGNGKRGRDGSNDAEALIRARTQAETVKDAAAFLKKHKAGEGEHADVLIRAHTQAETVKDAETFLKKQKIADE